MKPQVSSANNQGNMQWRRYVIIHGGQTKVDPEAEAEGEGGSWCVSKAEEGMRDGSRVGRRRPFTLFWSGTSYSLDKPEWILKWKPGRQWEIDARAALTWSNQMVKWRNDLEAEADG